ncbi:putative prophage protein, partial [Streptococcus pneumoniae]
MSVSRLFTDCLIFSAVTLSALISTLVLRPSVRRFTPASSELARCL